MNEKKDILWRAYLIYFGFVLIMLVVLFKTVDIQLEGRTTILSPASEGKMPIRIVKRTPRRGQILDVNYTPLVTSVAFYNIHFDPTIVDQKTFDAEIMDLAKGLARLYPSKTAREYANSIRTARARGNRYLSIQKNVTNDERKLLRELPIFKLGRLKGGLIDNAETVKRNRQHGELLRRTLGYYQNNRGEEVSVGIEGAYNTFLKGEEGEEIEQKISTGWKKTGQIVKESVEGADIILSIDKEIQEVAHSELERQLQTQGAKNGSVIVMDVKTGFVKAIVNLSKESDGKFYENYNYAIGTKEVPGSTFKLASLMAALEDEKIKITDTVNATGEYTFYSKKIKDVYKYGYGKITIQQAFEKSSNVIAKVIQNAYRHEPDAFIKRLKQFGLAEPLGIEILGEPTPTLYEPGSKNWSGISLPWIAIGYEVQQTPLQTLAFYNAVANNGALMKPQFVKEIRRGSQMVKTFSPAVIRGKICSENTLKIMQNCLKGVMKEGGTGSKLTSLQFEIAGKTGTARILNDKLSYGAKGEEKYQASFVGYFPADEPIYSCIVIVSAPTKDIYGATVSGTVFAAIANKVYATTLKYHDAINEGKKIKNNIPLSFDGNGYDLRKTYKALGIPHNNKQQSEWVVTQKQATKIELKPKKLGKNTVPNVVGMSAKDAVYLVESSGLVAHVMGYGKVKKQSIPAGKAIFHGGVIELVLE
jgi:cell division protein FtsI (penicillin-binding protein 3)